MPYHRVPQHRRRPHVDEVAVLNVCAAHLIDWCHRDNEVLCKVLVEGEVV